MVIIVMGVSGSGKTAVGRALARRMGCTFIDADDHHPPANKAKMAARQPLSEEDRGPWLAELRRLIDRAMATKQQTVLACSALTRAGRAALGAERAGVRLVHLTGPRELLAKRLAARTGHFMPADLLDSQLATLEPPGESEAIVVSVDQPINALVDRIMRDLPIERRR